MIVYNINLQLIITTDLARIQLMRGVEALKMMEKRPGNVRDIVYDLSKNNLKNFEFTRLPLPLFLTCLYQRNNLGCLLREAAKKFFP